MSIEQKVQDLEVKLTKVEERCNSNTDRISNAEDEIAETVSLVSAIKELAIETKYMREDLNKTITRIDKLEEAKENNYSESLRRENDALKKQADKWEKFKWLIVAALVTLVVSILATALNLK